MRTIIYTMLCICTITVACSDKPKSLPQDVDPRAKVLADSAFVLYQYSGSNKGNMERAIKLLDSAIQIQPDYMLAYYNKMSFQMEIGLKDSALETAEKIERLMPKSPWIRLQIGLMYEKYKKNYAHALLKYKEALSVYGPLTEDDYRNDPGKVFGFAINLKLLGRGKEADSVIEKLIKEYHGKDKTKKEVTKLEMYETIIKNTRKQLVDEMIQ